MNNTHFPMQKLRTCLTATACTGLMLYVVVKHLCLTFRASSSESPPSVCSRVAIIWATPTAELPAP